MKTTSIIIGLCLLSFLGFKCGETASEPSSMSISVVLGTGYAGDSIRIDLNSDQILNAKVTTNSQGIAWSEKYLSAWQEANNSFYFYIAGKYLTRIDIYLKSPSTVIFNYDRNGNTFAYQVLDGLIQ